MSRSKANIAGRVCAGGSLLVGGIGATVALAPQGSAILVAPATFTVTNLNDSGTGSLREAIGASNINPGADTVGFASGLSGTITLTTDPLVILDDLTILGPGADLLTVSGGGTLPGFVSFSYDANAPGTVVMSGLTVADTRAMPIPIPLPVGPGDDAAAGGITAINSSLTLSNIIVRDNFSDLDGGASNLGGAAVSHLGGGDLTIAGSQIRDNVSTGDGVGSGLLNWGGNLSIADSSITGNSQLVGGALIAVSGYYSGLAVFGGSIEISGSVISGNTTEAGWGGGVAYGNNVTVRNSLITDNSVLDTYGSSGSGGLAIVAATGATVSNTRISGNSSREVGGLSVRSGSAFYGGSDSTFTAILDRLTITDNVGGPADGQPGDTSGRLGTVGGLSLMTNALLTSSTISGNSGVGVDVSGFYGLFSPVSSPSAAGPFRSLLRNNRRNIASNTPILPPTVSIDHTTIADNSGDGLSSLRMNHTEAFVNSPTPTQPVITIGHSLLAGNTGQDLAAPATVRWSLLQKWPAVAVAESDNNLVGYDPELQPLENTSITVGVRPILFGSAAWNAGDPDFIPPPETDQRGLPRIVDIVDIGAYEVQEKLVAPAFTG